MMFFILDTAERLGFTRIFAEIEPRSPQGKKVKKAQQPFRPGEEKEFDQMSRNLWGWLRIAKRTDLIAKVCPLLSKLKSINGILERLAEGENLDEGECFEIKANLVITRKIWEELKHLLYAGGFFVTEIGSLEKPNLLGLADGYPIVPLDTLDELWKLLNPEDFENERFYLRDEYDPELQLIRQRKDELQQAIRRARREMQKDLEERLGRMVPASGEVTVSKGDAALLEYIQSRGDLHLERENFSAYFYKWTPGQQIRATEEELRQLEAEEDRVTARVLANLSHEIQHYFEPLQLNQRRLGELDWMLAKVEYAIKHNCIPPERVEKHTVSIEGGRHLLVEAEVKERGDEYTAIDLIINKGVTLITGSNMGGKTLNLRMIGLLTAMAQHGLCVPATEMQFSLREFIYFSVDDDQTKGDLSTFGQEIVGLKQALELQHKPGLYLIDELARGTNPEEGEALGKAIIAYLSESAAMTLLTTHFPALAELTGVCHYRVKGLNQEKYEQLKESLKHHGALENISLKLINRLMDYRLVKIDHSQGISRDAIRVAALLGLDDAIIKDAEQELSLKKRTKGVSQIGEKTKS